MILKPKRNYQQNKVSLIIMFVLPKLLARFFVPLNSLEILFDERACVSSTLYLKIFIKIHTPEYHWVFLNFLEFHFRLIRLLENCRSKELVEKFSTRLGYLVDVDNGRKLRDGGRVCGATE